MTVNITSAKLFKCLQMGLLVVILGLILWSKPWDSGTSSTTTRKITVAGEATISAEPDEFEFSPYYEEKGTDQEALKEKLTQKSNETVDKLKELGVEDKDIKLDVSSYDYWYWQEDEEGVLNAYITITIQDGDLVQQVQDYLLTTDAKGQLTPRASFSKEKRKQLDAQAVEEASTEARAKAEAQAKLFGAKLGDVIEVNQQRDSIFGYSVDAVTLESSDLSVSSAASLPVLQGEQDYSQTVSVVYELQ